MAYACPVCDTLHPDGEHLAHHLAITAMSRGGEHEAWLDETVSHWEAATPEELAADVVPHAEDVDHDLVDDPRASGSHDHDRPDVGERLQAGDTGSLGAGGLGGGSTDQPPGAGGAGGAGGEASGGSGGQPFSGGSIQDVQAPFGGEEVSPETAEVLEEARQLTEQRRENDEAGDEDATDDDRAADGRTSDEENAAGDERAADETDSDE